MQLGDKLAEYIKNFSSYRTTMDFGDVAEILIIAVLLYYALVWMKTTRAWVLLKGLVVILIFLLLAYFFRMTTILWMAQNVLGFAVTALIVVLQPELRKALEELGKKNIISSVLPFDNNHRVDEGFSEKTINEITKACVEMGKVKTGALIVIEQKVSLRDYERTGIDVDGIVTSQLLINIFEHNTPLHDGAVIVQGNRVASATGDHGTHSFICGLSGQPSLFYFGAYLLCDQLLHFIVVIDLRSRYRKKCGEFFDACFFCGTVGSCARCTVSGCLVSVTATSGEQCRCHC